MNGVNVCVDREGGGSEWSDAFSCSIYPSIGVSIVCEVESSPLFVEDQECMHEINDMLSSCPIYPSVKSQTALPNNRDYLDPVVRDVPL